MKRKISITIEEDTLKILKEKVESGAYRNTSHIIEFAVNELINRGEKKNGNI